MRHPTVAELVWLVAIAHVWSRGTIFRALREAGDDGACWRAWRALADCPLCSGCWIGLLGHALYAWYPDVVIVLGVGSVVGTASLAVYGAIRRL